VSRVSVLTRDNLHYPAAHCRLNVSNIHVRFVICAVRLTHCECVAVFAYLLLLTTQLVMSCRHSCHILCLSLRELSVHFYRLHSAFSTCTPAGGRHSRYNSRQHTLLIRHYLPRRQARPIISFFSLVSVSFGKIRVSDAVDRLLEMTEWLRG